MIEIGLKSSDLVYLSCSLYEVNNSKAVVQIIPGIKEHKSRYKDFIFLLNSWGYSVFISDTRGHGRSVSGNYPLGYIDDYQKLVSDQRILYTYLINRFPNQKIYIIGEDIGVDIALNFIQNVDVSISKLVLISPFRHDKSIDVRLTSAKLMLKLQNAKKSNPLIQNALGDLHIEKLVKDSNERNTMLNDNLCNFNYSNMAIANFLLLNKGSQAVNKYQNSNKDLPIQILFGANDELTGGREGIKGLISLLNRSGYKRIGNLEYMNMMHSILFETNKKYVYNDIINFLNV